MIPTNKQKTFEILSVLFEVFFFHFFFLQQKGKAVYFAWARGGQDATSSILFMKHGDKASGGRGHTSVGYDLFTGKEISAPSASSYIVSSALLLVFSVTLQCFV